MVSDQGFHSNKSGTDSLSGSAGPRTISLDRAACALRRAGRLQWSAIRNSIQTKAVLTRFRVVPVHAPFHWIALLVRFVGRDAYNGQRSGLPFKQKRY